MRPEPTIRQIRHFLALAETCHFGRAAEACFVTQSSLSASIKELEGVLGALLFERTKRSVMLTALGQSMVEPATELLTRLDDLTDMAGSLRAPLSGELRMGVIPTIGPFLLPRVMPALRQAYPDLRLYLREERTAPLLRQLAAGHLDLVMIALPYALDNLTAFTFADDPFLAVFPRGHPIANQEAVTLSRLAKDDLLVLEEGNCLTDQTLAMRGRPDMPAGSFQATSLHTLVQMVANGLGVSVLPKMAVDAGILRGLKLDFRPMSGARSARQIALAWRKTSHRGDEFKLLGECCRDELGTPVPRRRKR